MRKERKESHSKPHHMHALTKASARHLHKMGHLDRATHDEIIDHAERGMKRARGEKSE